MVYEFTTGVPITEREALKQVAALGLHGLALTTSMTRTRHCIGTSSRESPG